MFMLRLFFILILSLFFSTLKIHAEDRPGILADIASVFTKANLNIVNIHSRDIDAKIIVNFVDYINIYEQDIYGITLFDFIEKKYSINKGKQCFSDHSSKYFCK